MFNGFNEIIHTEEGHLKRLLPRESIVEKLSRKQEKEKTIVAMKHI